MSRSIGSRLGLRVPVMLAPMAGEPANAGFVAAVSNAGGLGSLGAAYLPPERMRGTIREIRQLTGRPFAVNLFAPMERPDPGKVRADLYLEKLAAFHRALGLEAPELPSASVDPFEEQWSVVLEERVPVFSYTFGSLGRERVRELSNNGTYVIGTATHRAEALALEAEGADAIVLQSSEAGGHRGTFLGAFEDALIGAMALVPAVVDAVSVPVIAAGGIADRRGVRAARALGADAVSVGTAFLTTEESPVCDAYRSALMAQPQDARPTRVTRAYSGRPARGIVNTMMTELDALREAIPPYPVTNALTRTLRQAASRQGNPEYLSLWSGQGALLQRPGTVADLVDELAAGFADVGP